MPKKQVYHYRTVLVSKMNYTLAYLYLIFCKS